MKTEAAKPRSRNRQATADALVAAASAVFAERGYENATTRTIAEAAGCSEGLIQRYFNGKEGLLLATLKDGPQEQAKLEFFERPLCASMVDEARECISQAARHMCAASQAIRIVMSRTLVDPTFCKDFARLTVRNVVRDALLARFERYVVAGLVGRDIDLPAAVELMLGINFQLGFMHPELMQTPRAEVQRLIARQAEMFARAVAPVALAAPTPIPVSRTRRPRTASAKASA